MKTWGNRDTIYSAVMKEILADKLAGRPPLLPDNINKWLAQLTLLYGVPVEYLIPDSRMLPVESMRFFYVDRNWLDRLVDGALSAGVFSSREQVFNEAFFESIYAQVDVMQLQLRSVLRNSIPSQPASTGGGITGVIFRSCVVAGWPGLEIQAWKGNDVIDIVRMDRLSDNILLCLFNGLPDRVEFVEPGEGLHFGIEKAKDAAVFDVYLRGLGFPDDKTYPAGAQIKKGDNYLKAKGSLRTGAGQEPGVVDIQGLKNSIIAAMPKDALQDGKLSPAGMAIQLVQGAGKQRYDLNSPACFFVPAKNKN